jgi:hypothetical protein
VVKEVPTILQVSGKSYYEINYIPVVSVDDRIKFRVKISNNSNRVLRPSSAVVSFNVDGAQTSVSEENYTDFLNALITPNATKEIEIYGPNLNKLKESKGTIAIDIYELNIGGKLANFSWILQYDKINRTINSFSQTEKKYLTPFEAQSLNGKLVKLTQTH